MTDADDANTPIEEWLAIPGFADYEVSSVGRVRRLTDGFRWKAGYLLSPSFNHRTGRTQVHLYQNNKRRGISVSRLMALAFHGEPPTSRHEAAHNDGKPWNNVPDNIQWKTPAENQADRGLHGTKNAGERHPLAKLNEAQVRAIRQQNAAGIGQRTLGRMYGVHKSTIAGITRGQRWKNVE